MSTKQKLVTVFLHDKQDKGKGAYGDPSTGSCFGVQEHLQEYLDDGWEITEIKTLGGAGGCLSGWIVAVLKKSAY